LEKRDTRLELLDAALELLGTSGSSALTVRAVEAAAGMPHGSVRHHFGGRAGMITALFDRLAERDARHLDRDLATAVERWLGPGRTLTLARYELFLMAARDPALRPALLQARERFVVQAAERVGPDAARATVAAVDGLVLDALIRGTVDRAAFQAAIARML
jgi:AcrR family transcriptional regulator